MNASIAHKGRVIAVDGKIAIVTSEIDAKACGGCALSVMCARANEIQAEIPQSLSGIAIGSEVVVEASSLMWAKAIILMLVVPIFIMLCALAGGAAIGMSQLGTGLVALLLPVLWYLLMFVLRKHINKPNIFRITRLNV